jgi:hypothetical protein
MKPAKRELLRLEQLVLQHTQARRRAAEGRPARPAPPKGLRASRPALRTRPQLWPPPLDAKGGPPSPCLPTHRLAASPHNPHQELSALVEQHAALRLRAAASDLTQQHVSGCRGGRGGRTGPA